MASSSWEFFCQQVGSHIPANYDSVNDQVAKMTLPHLPIKS